MLKYGLSLVALVAANPAFAQADDDIVVTAAGIEQSRDEVGQAITVIDADTIKTRQAIDVVDLLATTPGVRFNRNGTVGAQTGVSLRGAETTQTLVLIDGVKVNDPSGIGDGYDFGPLLTGNIRRIEVLRGSNSVVHGSQAIGGVVNIMTGVPAEGFGANASAEYGYSDTFSAKADISGTAGIASGGVGAAYFRTDGISSAANGTERDGSENIAANARLKLAFSDSLSLDLRGYYIHADLDVDGFPAPAYILADTPEVAITDQYVGYAGINLALLDGKLTNRAAVTWMRNDRDYYSARGADVDYGYSGTNLRFEYEGVYAPVDQAKLVFGYEHERPDYDYYDAFSTTSAKINIDSVYALAIVKPFTGLAVTGGLRHDDHSQFGGATTFGANANYSPNGGATNVRLSYGEGFKAPSLYQLYDTFSGNRALTPERSKSYDVGFDQRLDGGRAVLSVTAFQRDTRNQINYDVSLPPFGGYANLDRTRAKGVEASIALKPVDALTVTGSYSYVDARDRSVGSATYGNRLARRAANAVSVSADYVWPFGLSTGATVTMVGDSFDNAANTRRLDGYALAGIRASFPVGEHLEVYGRVDNLTDENYQTAYGYGTYGRAAYGGVRVRF
ncbi:TonB-dependent receptor plug domain-containing protein [Sphingobium limneticum]|uniref:TonB-dependent receptor n=1 Tax=Sphingobium limneticum TaxID=1007511 RepID=A0A5J5I4S1_9SPHN|nr:TonB-dependent receptor [Sphingobium limneticum]KAA9017578.1 TonB-dependent receptor [Sphingobium limneticum]KAA9030168.1 TonB-dependent receptor [Sphingobium limneticum]